MLKIINTTFAAIPIIAAIISDIYMYSLLFLLNNFITPTCTNVPVAVAIMVNTFTVIKPNSSNCVILSAIPYPKAKNIENAISPTRNDIAILPFDSIGCSNSGISL